MNKHGIYTVLVLLTACIHSIAQTGSVYDFYQLKTLEPWANMQSVSFLSDVTLTPTYNSIGFASASADTALFNQGKQLKIYNAETKCYRKINRTTLFGQFHYENQTLDGIYGNNVDRMAMAYPYVMMDTIGGDKYSRERFILHGAVAFPLTKHLHHGISFDYDASVAVQDRDPRPENTVALLGVNYGVHLKNDGNFSPAIHLHYNYYNEDIDIDVIEQNQYHTIYYHHGLGVSTNHHAGSFYRLYIQNEGGASLQLKYENQQITSYTSAKFTHAKLITNDGRKSGNASWATIKNDSELKKNHIAIQQFFLFGNQHMISIDYAHRKHVGTEFIQKLEKINETDLEHWVTYATEDKYKSTYSNAHLTYAWIKLDRNKKLKSELGADLQYISNNESYIHPAYLNRAEYIEVGLNTKQKLINKKQVLWASASVRSHIAISNSHLLNLTDPLVQKIIEPNIKIANEDRWTTQLGLTYQFKIKKIDWAAAINYTNITRQSKQQSNKIECSVAMLL